MAALTPQQFAADIKPRAILYFSDPEALNTPSRHYFICISPSPEGHLVFSCCTSQFATVKGMIEHNAYENATLAFIKASDPDNPFDKDTYVNCNEYFVYSLRNLWSKYLSGDLSFKSELPLDSFEQILIGLGKSDQIEEEVKELLPNISDL